MKVVVFYDADNDGYMAAAIVSMYLDGIYNGVTKDFFPLRPRGKVNEKKKNKMEEADRNYLLDLSIPEILYFNPDKLCWYDHHKSVEEKFGRVAIAGKQEIGKSTSRLVWEDMFSAPMPLVVDLTDRYDVFRDEYNSYFEKSVIPFQCIMERMRSIEVYKKIVQDDRPSRLIATGSYLWKTEKDQFYEAQFLRYFPNWGIGGTVVTKEIQFPGRFAYLYRLAEKKQIAKPLWWKPGLSFYINQNDKVDETGVPFFTYSVRRLKDTANCLDLIREFNFSGGGHEAAAGFRSEIDHFRTSE